MFDPDAKIMKGTPEQIREIEENQKKINSDPLLRLREEIDMIRLSEKDVVEKRHRVM